MKNEQTAHFKNYFHYCKVISNHEGKRVLPFYLKKLWIHSYYRNKAQIQWRKLKCYLTNTEYKPYPNERIYNK